MAICKLCNKEYKRRPHDTNSNYCYDCSSKKIIIKCSNCGREKEISLTKYNPNKNSFCNNTCLNEFYRKPGICISCGRDTRIENKKRTITGKCIECHSKTSLEIANKLKGPGYCTRCGIWNENRSISGLGTSCGCSSIKIKENQSSGFCIKCNRFCESRSVTGLCKECQYNVSIKNIEDFIKDPNFTTKDGVLYYKDQEWESYKDSFITKDMDCRIFDKYNGFWQKTYLINDIDLTGKDAMERELLEKEISWFVYIKFYMDSKNNIKPLVCGKTGSRLVNSSGTDINFSYNDENGSIAGRRLLNEKNLKWYKEQIYIIPCNSEENTLKLEKEIQEEYNLFGG